MLKFEIYSWYQVKSFPKYDWFSVKNVITSKFVYQQFYLLHS